MVISVMTVRMTLNDLGFHRVTHRTQTLTLTLHRHLHSHNATITSLTALCQCALTVLCQRIVVPFVGERNTCSCTCTIGRLCKSIHFN